MFFLKNYKPPTKVILTPKKCRKITEKFAEKNGCNTVLSQNVQWSTNGQKTYTNNNVLVIGNKDKYGLLRANIEQSNANLIMVDVDGKLYERTRESLEKKGYTVKTINFANPEGSNQYNPFQYISRNTDVDILRLADGLLEGRRDEPYYEAFFETAKKELLCAIIHYIVNYCEKERQKLSTIMMFLYDCLENYGKGKKSKLDMVYESIIETNPEDAGYYCNFRNCGNANVRYSIVIDCFEQLSILNTPKVKQLTDDDTVNFDTFGNTKQALFIIVPEGNTSYKNLISIMYRQFYYISSNNATLQNILREPSLSGRSYGLNFHTITFMDFEYMQKFNDLAKIIACSRKLNISHFLFFSTQKQIEKMYEDKSEFSDIIGWPDIMLLYDNMQEEFSYLNPARRPLPYLDMGGDELQQ